MKPDSVRTPVDIPAPILSGTERAGCAQGRSIRELLVAGAKSVVLKGRRSRSKRVRFPLIVSEGPKVELTNEEIYEHVELP